MSNNRLSVITSPKTDLPIERPKIKILSLAGNNLISWNDVDNLADWLPSLQSIHFAGNPLAEELADKLAFARLLTARLPSLTKLNGSLVSNDDRIDSERYYLVHISKVNPTMSDSDKARLYPRWIELCEKHGRPETIDPSSKSSKLKSRLITINMILSVEAPPPNTSTPLPLKGLFSSLSSDSDFFNPPINPRPIKILPTMTTNSFIMKVRKVYKLPRYAKLAFYLLFTTSHQSQTHGGHERNKAEPEEEFGTFVPLDFSPGVLSKGVELTGIDDGSTVLCYISY